jgi:subtilisin family serine protease
VATNVGPRNYALASGTSYSAGLVGGAAALLLQANPELLPAELERILGESSVDVPPPGPDNASGSGLVDVAAALEILRARERP